MRLGCILIIDTLDIREKGNHLNGVTRLTMKKLRNLNIKMKVLRAAKIP